MPSQFLVNQWKLVKLPDGKISVYSHRVDNFINGPFDQEEAFDFLRQRGCTSGEALHKLEDAVAKEYQFIESAQTIRHKHGEEVLLMILEELGVDKKVATKLCPCSLCP